MMFQAARLPMTAMPRDHGDDGEIYKSIRVERLRTPGFKPRSN